jgi:hypothetical protein
MSSFLADSSPLSLSEVWVIVSAALGGIIVFAGLLLEKIAEWKNEKFGPPFFKPHKFMGECGWWILMFGIAAEIVVAVWSANDAWQTRQMAIKNDPVNLPIKSMAVAARLLILANNSPDSEVRELAIFGGRLDILDKSGNRIAALDCKEFDNSSRLGDNSLGLGGSAPSGTNIWLYSLGFVWPATGVSSFLPTKLAHAEISTKVLDKEIAGARLWIPSGKGGTLRIINGSCVLTINGSLQRSFLIPNSLTDIFLIDTNHL